MQIANKFPLLNTNPKLVYLDSAATTLKPQVVIDAELEFLTKNGASPHNQTYKKGFEAEQAVHATRQSVATLINASSPEEVVFTSGATASLNQIAFGLIDEIHQNDEIWLTTLEHGSNLLPWVEVAKKTHAKIKFMPLNDAGLIDLQALEKVLTTKAKIVTFAHATNSLGGLNSVSEISKLVRKLSPKTFIVVDSAQTIAHAKIDVQKWDIDFLAFSSHKMYGPFGVGVLWGSMPKLKILKPLMYGGGMNLKIDPETLTYKPTSLPSHLEAGTSNVSGIVALKTAVNFLNDVGLKKISEHEKKLKQYFKEKVKANNLVKEINFYNLDSDSPIILFNSKKWKSQDVATFLDVRYQIAVRDGEHCARLANRFLGVHDSVRASIGIYNTEKDIDRLIEALKNLDQCLEVFI